MDLVGLSQKEGYWQSETVNKNMVNLSKNAIIKHLVVITDAKLIYFTSDSKFYRGIIRGIQQKSIIITLEIIPFMI